MATSSAQALYAHIHRLLDEHVVVHLATDYIDCTQLRVFQALTGGLLPVSVDDPHSLVLPSDPLDDFIKEHCQIEMKDMYEKFPAVKKTQELIWCTMNAKSIERTFTSRFTDKFCSYSEFFAEPSVLSVHSIHHTPRLGWNKKPHTVPLDLREVISLSSVKSASVEEDEDPDARTEDFHCRLAVDHHNLKEILLTCQASPFSTPHTSGTESRVSNKLLLRTPSPPLLAPLPQTPPLFSRKDIAPKQPAYVPASMSDLRLVAPSKSSDSDEGTPEYATVDDEWAVSSTLSPPSSCLNNSPNKQDIFFVLSSESRGPTDDIFAAKMDTFYMPRQSRVGGSCEGFRVPGQNQQLHEYISSAVCSTRGQNKTTTPSKPNSIASPRTSVHRVNAFPTPNNMCQSSDDSFLGQLIIDFANESIDTVLLDQSTDTRSGLMNVPQLPAPNVHTHDTVWPNDMKSLVTDKVFSTFNALKGIKSLNLELSWRPFDSEQTIPAVDELVGVSEVHYSVVGEEAKNHLADLLKWLNYVAQPISAEEESRGEPQVLSESIPNFNSVTVVPDPPDREVSNVLLTRAERLKSRLPSKNHLKIAYGCARQWDDGNYTTQSQNLGRSKVDSPLEGNNHGQNTEPDLVDLRTLVCGRTLLSEDGTHDAEIDKFSAPHVQLPGEFNISLSPDGLSLNSDPVCILESSKAPNPDWIHPSKTSGLESNHWSASFELATCEEQSLQGYLKILAKHPPSGQADDGMHFSTSPACSKLRRLSNSPTDSEGLLRELSNLASPLPPLATSSHYNHRYLASVELLQDRPLMRALCLDSLRMELVEREWVDGADIVFDCDTALVFMPLFQVLLPSGFASLKDRLSALSWKYTHLAVVFKLYEAGISGLQQPQDDEEQMNLSSRVIRSIKKLQRGLALAEAYAIKRPQAVILMYFVQSVEQAAATTRLLGDVAESRSQLGPWGDRSWLRVDEMEEERYLAGVDGMNAFAAAVVLSQISLHDFLSLRADQRLQLILPIPESMMERFNEVIAQRHEDVDTFVEDDDGAY